MTVSAAVGSAAAVTKRGQVLSSDPESALARVRSICLALPEAEEKISHGTAAFHVGGRMFAYFRHDHHRDGHTSVCVKTSGRDEQDMLMEADPAHFSWPAYIGPAGWIALSLSDADEHIWEVADHRIRASYELAAPRRRSSRV